MKDRKLNLVDVAMITWLTVMLLLGLFLVGWGISTAVKPDRGFTVVESYPLSDSDRLIQIVKDNKTGKEYIVDGNNWVKR